MKQLFFEILSMSLSGSLAACGVLLVRLLLKRAPRFWSCLLWAVVFFRLVCPAVPESGYAVLPSRAAALTGAPWPVPLDGPSGQAAVRMAAAPGPDAAAILSLVWLAGCLLLAAYMLLAQLRLQRRLRTATLVRDNLFETDRISTPFVMGLLRPRIYVPLGISEDHLRLILQHERTHIRRGDHLVKFLAFLVLCLHWFNPMVWLSYGLLCRDLETACDEAVLRRCPEDVRAMYSTALLALSARRSGLTLGFAEAGTRQRIRHVLHYRRPAFWVSLAALLAVVMVTAVFAMERPVLPESAAQGEIQLPETDLELEPAAELEAEPQEVHLWTNVPVRDDWSAEDMNFNRITFGSERDYLIMRMWEPDREEALPDGGSRLEFDVPPTRMSVNGGEWEELPDTGGHVSFVLDADQRVIRIDTDMGCEMTGKDQPEGSLAGVLAHYGGPNEVEQVEDRYLLWYYLPEHPEQRMWFEVYEEELTMRMGILQVSSS